MTERVQVDRATVEIMRALHLRRQSADDMLSGAVSLLAASLDFDPMRYAGVDDGDDPCVLLTPVPPPE